MRKIKSAAKHCLPRLYSRLVEKKRKALKQRVEMILASSDEPHFEQTESAFDKLQVEYRGVPEYGYDPFSTWARGVDRCKELLKLDSLRAPGRQVLEVACGDAMTSFLLNGFGHAVQLADCEDWRDERAQLLSFQVCDVCKELPFTSNRYDLVFSYNAFEHFSDPANALREMVRVCRPGGYLFFEFGPLYAGPWGLHAYRSLNMPYPQFLFSKSFILEKLSKVGIRDLGKERTELQYTNGWRYQNFQDLWREAGCEVVRAGAHREESYLRLISQYPFAFCGRGLTLDDVTIQSLYVNLRKPN